MSVRQQNERSGGLWESARNAMDVVLGHDKIHNLIWTLHDQELAKLDFLRNEILFEMRYGCSAKAGIETRIINRHKYEEFAQRHDVILNIGCGNRNIENMLNVDQRELPNVDIVADAADIQLPKESVHGIFSSHVLEHFPHEQLRRAVLPNWVGLLQKGGYFKAVVPDAENMIRSYVAGRLSFDDLCGVTFGLQEYEGDMHYTMFSKDSLKSLLEEAGLQKVEYTADNRPNGKCLEMEVVAYK